MSKGVEKIEDSLPPGQVSFSETQLADITGIKSQTFRKWRCNRSGGPTPTKMGCRVQYLRQDVVDWLKNSRIALRS